MSESLNKRGPQRRSRLLLSLGLTSGAGVAVEGAGVLVEVADVVGDVLAVVTVVAVGVVDGAVAAGPGAGLTRWLLRRRLLPFLNEDSD